MSPKISDGTVSDLEGNCTVDTGEEEEEDEEEEAEEAAFVVENTEVVSAGRTRQRTRMLHSSFGSVVKTGLDSALNIFNAISSLQKSVG